MPDEEPVIDHATAVRAPVSQGAAAHAGGLDDYAPHDEGEWLEQPAELPPRPRRRLLGAGANRAALALLAVLLIACGFIGGVLVEKGQTTSGSSAGTTAASIASRFAALRGGSFGTGSRSAGAGALAGAAGFAAAGARRPTAGTVAYLAGSTLYVTNAEGNTVKVKTSPATSVSKTAKASVSAIHPGETVTVTGASGQGGAITAESISVGSAAAALASLLGAGSGSSPGSGAGGAPSLFGSG